MSAIERIVLQKSKIERLRKSREGRFLDVSTAAKVCRADTKVRGRFCVRRCGPSRRRVRNASAAIRNFVRHPKGLFQHYRPIAEVIGLRASAINLRIVPYPPLDARRLRTFN